MKSLNYTVSFLEKSAWTKLDETSKIVDPSEELNRELVRVEDQCAELKTENNKLQGTIDKYFRKVKKQRVANEFN